MTELARRNLIVINLQVLNELCHVSLRKLTHLSPAEIRAWADELRVFGETVVDADLVEAAWSIYDQYRLSWFDCLLISAAETLGCSHFLTEDMGAGRQIGSIVLVDPFKTEPEDVLSRH